MKSLISFLFSALFVLGMNAHEIQGKVVDANGMPLPFSVVSIDQSGRQTVARQDGNFTLRGIDSGTHKLSIRHIGFSPCYLTARITDDNVVLDTCVLEVLPIQSNESVELPDETTMEQYILQNIWKYCRKLKDLDIDYVCDAKFTMNQDFDYSIYPKRLRNFLLLTNTLAGRRASWIFMSHHPSIDATVEGQLTCKAGKIKASKGSVTYSNFTLRGKDKDGLMQLVDFFPSIYDAFNDSQTGILGQKYAPNVTWEYKGAYEENGRTIYVLECSNAHVEVVKDLWCIRAYRTTSALNSQYNEYIFDEVLENVFLPVAFVQQMKMNADDVSINEQEWEELKSEAQSNNERVHAIEKIQQQHTTGETKSDVTFLVTYKYNI